MTANTFEIQIGDDQLNYRPLTIRDPIPTGRQLLELSGANPVVDHLLFQVLKSGLLEELRHDETTDLTESGVEKFLVFKADRSFRFELDDRVFEWGGARVSGLVLKKLASVDPATYAVYLRRPGQDPLIEDGEQANLQPEGVERFYTRRTVFNIVVNGDPKIWRSPTMSYEQIVQIAFPDGPRGENVRYNVSWTKPSGEEGVLRRGQSVDVVEGMSFHVRNTDKS